MQYKHNSLCCTVHVSVSIEILDVTAQVMWCKYHLGGQVNWNWTVFCSGECFESPSTKNVWYTISKFLNQERHAHLEVCKWGKEGCKCDSWWVGNWPDQWNILCWSRLKWSGSCKASIGLVNQEGQTRCLQGNNCWPGLQPNSPSLGWLISWSKVVRTCKM